MSGGEYRKFNTSFVRNFKTGDNICLNVQSVVAMHEARNALPAHEKWKLNKPMVLAVASIIEACLFELVERARFNTREGVPNIAEKHLSALRKSKKDGLDFLVSTCRQLKILGTYSDPIYGNLEKLTRLRDRIHIQNKYKYEPRCERQAFSNEALARAKQILERVLVVLSEKFTRPMCYTQPVVIPWNYGEGI